MAMTFTSDSPGFDEEKGFICTPKDVKRILWVVSTVKAENFFMGETEDDANRVAACVGGVVSAKEVPIDFSKMPNPTDWADESDETW